MASGVKQNFTLLAGQARKELESAIDPESATIIQVGNATCENAAGARSVYAEFGKLIEASGKSDRIVLRQTGCTGRCSCEPIVGISRHGSAMAKYSQVDTERVHRIFTRHVIDGEPILDWLLEPSAKSAFGGHTLFFCRAPRCGKLLDIDFPSLFMEKIKAFGGNCDNVSVIKANCFGFCRADQVGRAGYVMILPEKIIYRIENEAELEEICREHIIGGRVVEHLVVDYAMSNRRFFEMYGDVAFFNRQDRIALRNCGIIDPESLDEYLSVGGYEALTDVLDLDDPVKLIEEISRRNRAKIA